MFDRILVNHTRIPMKVEVSSLSYYNSSSKVFKPVPNNKAIIRQDTGHIYSLNNTINNITSPVDVLACLLDKFGRDKMNNAWSVSNDDVATKNVFFIPMGKQFSNTSIECVAYFLCCIDYMRLEVKMGLMEDFGDGANIAWWDPSTVINLNKKKTYENFTGIFEEKYGKIIGKLENHYNTYLSLMEYKVGEDYIQKYVEGYHKVRLDSLSDMTRYYSKTVQFMVQTFVYMLHKYDHSYFSVLSGMAKYLFYRYDNMNNTYNRITLGLANREINNLYNELMDAIRGNQRSFA